MYILNLTDVLIYANGVGSVAQMPSVLVQNFQHLEKEPTSHLQFCVLIMHLLYIYKQQHLQLMLVDEQPI